MSKSLEDLLKNRSFDEPPEIAVIKRFVEAKFKQTPIVTISQAEIIIGVKSGALAGALRPLLPQLEDQLNSAKKLRIRIQHSR